MKKILFAVLALATMASCSNEYTVEMDREAIAFGDTFVDNATKADYSVGKTLNSFQVWGNMKGVNPAPIQIFDGDEVARPTGLAGFDSTTAWICQETQYWLPETTYNFVAIADATSVTCDANGLPSSIEFTVTDGNGDLLYAALDAPVVTDEHGDPGLTNDLVGFTFNHLLSKVQFTVVDDMEGSYTVSATKITVGNIYSEGTYDVVGNVWSATDPKVSLDFTAGASRQVIPVSQILDIEVEYDILYNGTKVSSYTKGSDLTVDFAGDTVYNITATIGANKIEFTVDAVEGFGGTATGNTTLE